MSRRNFDDLHVSLFISFKKLEQKLKDYLLFIKTSKLILTTAHN